MEEGILIEVEDRKKEPSEPKPQTKPDYKPQPKSNTGGFSLKPNPVENGRKDDPLQSKIPKEVNVNKNETPNKVGPMIPPTPNIF
jgi:hypothetical protein